MIELAGSGSPVPLMLDESIEKESDLDMVLDSGCAQAVKFKLMKCASREELERLIHKAQSAGLKVIVGNGVSLDISCLFEAASLFRSRLTENAGEMNGFLKSQVDYLQPGLGAANGRLIFPDHWPGVRWDQVAANALETVHWGEINPDR
jgi:L-alanine-DL-glutamate epimerase-like enolase superfamily enzyme